MLDSSRTYATLMLGLQTGHGDVADWEGAGDNRLMAAVSEGDRLAFETLYNRHVRTCFSFAMWFVRDSTLAEDIVQEVFIKLWTRPHTYSPSRGNFRSWLLTVVRYQAVDKLRQKERQATLPILLSSTENADSYTLIDLLPDPVPTSHEQICQKELAHAVWYALRQLPPEQYQTITLAYFDGLSQSQIAEKLDQPLGTVKTRTRLALRRLHSLLAGQNAVLD